MSFFSVRSSTSFHVLELLIFHTTHFSFLSPYQLFPCSWRKATVTYSRGSFSSEWTSRIRILRTYRHCQGRAKDVTKSEISSAILLGLRNILDGIRIFKLISLLMIEHSKVNHGHSRWDPDLQTNFTAHDLKSQSWTSSMGSESANYSCCLSWQAESKVNHGHDWLALHMHCSLAWIPVIGNEASTYIQVGSQMITNIIPKRLHGHKRLPI